MEAVGREYHYNRDYEAFASCQGSDVKQVQGINFGKIVSGVCSQMCCLPVRMWYKLAGLFKKKVTTARGSAVDVDIGVG
jgi:hypothetical protein